MDKTRPINQTIPSLIYTVYTIIGVLITSTSIVIFSTPTLRLALDRLEKFFVGFILFTFLLGFFSGIRGWRYLNNKIGKSLEGENTNRDEEPYYDNLSGGQILWRYTFIILSVCLGLYIYSWRLSLLISIFLPLIVLLTFSTRSSYSIYHPVDERYWNSTTVFMIGGLISAVLFGITGGVFRYYTFSTNEWISKILEEEFWIRWEIAAVLLHVVVVTSFVKDFFRREEADKFEGERPQGDEMFEYTVLVLVISFLSAVTMSISAYFFFTSIGSNVPIEKIYIFGFNIPLDTNVLHLRYFLYALVLSITFSILVYVDWLGSYLCTNYSFEYSLREMLLFGDLPLLLGTTTLIISYVYSLFYGFSFHVRSALFGGGIAFQLVVINTLFIITKVRDVNGAYNMKRWTFYTCGNDSCDWKFRKTPNNRSCPSCGSDNKAETKTLWVKDSYPDNIFT